jgi:polyhydroxyalkanoate synthesis regulator phasin
MVDVSLLDIWNKANKIDEWPEAKDAEEITREDVETLKADWVADPIWDLDGTEGFESYHDELKAFSDAKKAEWEAQREQEEQQRISGIHRKAEELGCSFGVAQYISCLEGRVKHLERQVGILLEHSDAAYREVRGF